jgi:hypothetical protein
MLTSFRYPPQPRAGHVWRTRVTRAVSIVLAAGALVFAAESVAAPPVPVAPASGSTYVIGNPLAFSVQFSQTGWPGSSRLKVRLSTSASIGGNGVLSSGTTLSYPSGGSPYVFDPMSFERPSAPGRYYWQPYAEAYFDGSTNYPLEVGPIQTLDAVMPAGPTAFTPASGTRYRMTSSRSITFTASGQSSAFDRGDILISRSPAVDGSGKLGADVLSDYLGSSAGGSVSYTTPSWVNIAGKPGTYYWQVSLGTYGGTATVYSPIQSLEIAAPEGFGADGLLRRDAVPRWVGTRGSWVYRINRSYGVPANISAQWFHDLARLSAGRWGLTYGGTTNAVPGMRDGVSTVGFSYNVPAGVLGVTATGVRIAKRKVRSCKRVRGVRRCKVVRRTTRVPVEQDLYISRAPLWEQGPAYPLSNTYDLESVLVHEFGHMASSRNSHVYGCTNSPMIVAAGPGDWWRSPTDWARRGCSQGDAASEKRARDGKRLRFEHLTYDVATGQRLAESPPAEP